MYLQLSYKASTSTSYTKFLPLIDLKMFKFKILNCQIKRMGYQEAQMHPLEHESSFYHIITTNHYLGFFATQINQLVH
jgi:hypothetical protein